VICLTRGVTAIRSLPRAGVAAILALVVVVGFGWRAHYAANPKIVHQSQDEFSYVTLGQLLATRGTYAGREHWPLRWPPGTPFFFAAAYKIDHSGARSGRRPDIPSAYWAQAVVGTATIAIAFILAALIAGSVAGLLAAAAVALYPPLVTPTAELLSEPLGTLVLACAVTAVVWALRSAPSARRCALAGALLGGATLVRADFLFLPFVLAIFVAIVLRRRGVPRPVLPALALLASAVVVTAPWSAYVSARAHQFTLFTTGDAPVLFSGTCLPCDGTLQGMKRVYGDETRR
jgi:hypothetical protein